MIESPFFKPDKPIEISVELLEKIKKELGVECVFLVVAEKSHDCSQKDCEGHQYFVRATGFSDGEIRGMGYSLSQQRNYPFLDGI